MIDNDEIGRALTKALQDRINEALEAEIVEVRERIEQRIRREVGSIAASMFKAYDIQRQGDLISIRVKIEGFK